MSVDGNRIEQKETWTRDRPGIEGDGSSSGYGMSFLETLTAAISHPKKATTAQKAESALYLTIGDYEEDLEHLDTQ